MVRKGFSNTVISLLICSLLISCKSSARQIIELDDYYYSFITQEEIEEKGFIKKLNEFDSEITICFEDKEHFKHLYVFAAPIRYQDKFGSKLVLIDDRIVDCLESDETYRYEVANSDIITKFPTILSSDNGIFLEKGCGIEYYPQSEKSVEALYECHPNLIGESIDMIVYENLLDNVDLRVYPSLMGVQNEIIINKPSDLTQINFMFHIENAIPEQMEGGYVLLQNNDQIMGIVQAPILTDSSKSANVSIHNTISIEPMGDSWFEFTVYLDQDFLENKNIHYPLRLSLPVELRRDKQPDTPIYSSRPDSNQYLSNVTELGKGKLGTGKSYIRFVLANLFQIDPSRIQSVKYYTYSLNPINADIYLYEVLEDWCSLTTTWNTPIKVGEAIAKTNGLHSGEQVFDITTQAKKWFSDPSHMLERYGVMMQANTQVEKSVVLLSNDNALYPTRTEIIFR